MDIEVKGVAKRYGQTMAVSDVSFGVEQGHVLSLLGPSGCGKTTVMRMIAGLIAPSAGSIAIKGKPVNQIPVHKRNVGMLFQNYALFPHLDVSRNIAFGLDMRGLGKAGPEAAGLNDGYSYANQRHLASEGLRETFDAPFRC